MPALFGRAVLVDHPRHHVVNRQIGRNRRATGGQRLENQRGIQTAQTGAADILAHIDGGHAEFGGFAHHVDRKMARLIPFQRMGRKLAIGKVACHIADGDPVFVEGEKLSHW